MSRVYDGDELPDELRDTAAKLLGIVREIDLDADGLPCNPSQEFEIWSATGWAHRLTAVLRSPMGTPAGEVRAVADGFGGLVIATKGHRSPAIGQRWLRLRDRASVAFGELFGPPEVAVPDAVPADAIASLRDSANPDGPPGVWTDADGRAWIELDPGDEEWSDEQVAALPHCVGCREPVVPGVEHSGCHRTVA